MPSSSFIEEMKVSAIEATLDAAEAGTFLTIVQAYDTSGTFAKLPDGLWQSYNGKRDIAFRSRNIANIIIQYSSIWSLS